MKKILSMLLLLAGVTMFTSCGDDDPTYTAPAKLDIKSADAFFEATGGTGTIVVNSSEAFTATPGADWITASVSGNTVTVTAAANSQLEGRSTTILLQSATASTTVSITQKGIIFGLEQGLAYTMKDVAGTVNIPISRTANVTVSSNADWLKAAFDGDNNNIVLTAETNPTLESRSALVAIATGVVRDTLQITQQPMTFALANTSASIPSNDETTVAVGISHSQDVKVESQNSWIKAALSEKGDQLLITADANTTGGGRIGSIVLTSGNEQIEVSVTQLDFASTIVGNYVLYYYDTQVRNYVAFEAELTESALTFLFPATATVTLPYSIPATIDYEKGTVTLGPCGSYMGRYGAAYWIYLGWLTDDGDWSGITNTTDVMTGALSIEEEEGEYATYLEWTGSVGKSEIIGWGMVATAAEGFSADNYAGFLKTLYYPYMQKLADNADESTEPAASISKRQRSIKLKDSIKFIK